MSKELREIIEKYEEEIIRIHKGWMEHRLLFTEMSDKLSELKNQAIQQIKQFARDEWVLSEEEIKEIILKHEEIFVYEDETIGEGIDFGISAKAINSKMREEIEKEGA